MKNFVLVLCFLLLGSTLNAIPLGGNGVTSANISANLPDKVVTLTPRTYVGQRSYAVTTGVMEIIATGDSYYYDYRTNLIKNSEDLSSVNHNFNLCTRTTTTINFNNVILTLVTGNNFYSSIREYFSSGNYAIFTSGNYYMVSGFVSGNEQRFFSTRYIADIGDYGHGQRYTSSTGNRYWFIAKATSPYSLELSTYDTSTHFNISYNPVVWRNTHGSFGTGVYGATFNVYAGGFQIEPCLDPTQDVLVVGDSTWSGQGSYRDSIADRGVPRWCEGLLNNDWHCRASPGFRYDNLVDSWYTFIQPSITTWNSRIKYCVIQGGINDIVSSIATATITINAKALYDLAVSHNYIPIMLTITPISEVTASAKEVKRRFINSWITANFTNVIDISTYMGSPTGSWDCRPEWKLDALHHNATGKEAYGRFVASSPIWSALATPSAYTKTLATPLINAAVTGNALVSGNIGYAVINNQSTANMQLTLDNSTPAVGGAGIPLKPGGTITSVDLGMKLNAGSRLKIISDSADGATANIIVLQ